MKALDFSIPFLYLLIFDYPQAILLYLYNLSWIVRKKLIRKARLNIGKRRLVNILTRHKICLARTLEQKISDAGPYSQRVDPHILSDARKELEGSGRIIRLIRSRAPWYHLVETLQADLNHQLAELEPIHSEISNENFSKRVGQALEIAVFKALRDRHDLHFLGHFNDLEDHGDEQLYSKLEPPYAISGLEIPNKKRTDFLVIDPSSGLAGIEVKNIREWLYPDRDDIRDLLFKCCHLDAVPVLIGRRIPYVTFSVLHPCGVLVHQTYNQRYPVADSNLAKKAKDKNLLGYHDIRLGNDPDDRLIRFIHNNLANLLPQARERFDEFKDLLFEFATGSMDYPEFAGRARRRQRGEPED